jgi:carbon starvation protein
MVERLKRYDPMIWIPIALLGAFALGTIAVWRGEHVNAAWFVIAAVCLYLTMYRFYSKFLANKVFGLDDRRATPAEKLDNGRDFMPMDKRVVYGHHFAAIAGAGPLVGPILAAQFGYLPGILWIMIGVVLAGAVQDFVILFASVRRNGKSLGQMAREEIGPIGGAAALITVFIIMIIILAVLALVFTNAAKNSPWSTFTIACTIPIAIGLGYYLRNIRPGKVIEGSLIGVALLLVSVWLGGVIRDTAFGKAFDLAPDKIVWLVIAYGFIAAVLPVWVLLAPRDYLSSFMKIGTILFLALGVLLVHPETQMPALTKFAQTGLGPVFAGGIFPFAFIFIACGAVSGFHSLIASGTTPKMLRKESDARLIGYGGMLMESFVAVMAMVAAIVLVPGEYFAITVPALKSAANAAKVVTDLGFPVTPDQLNALAKNIGEKSIVSRTGGAPTLAVGMAKIFSNFIGGQGLMSMWYHFAIMFEALFILTTIDAGTRVARFMLQDTLGNVYKPLARTSWMPGVLVSSAVVCAGWGYLLYQGVVVDPLGGINSLFPLFGTTNQLLAGVALIVGTTILLKMGRLRYIWTTAVPAAWLLTTTLTAAYLKAFDPNPKIGFFAHADALEKATPQVAKASQMIFNDRLDGTLAIVLGVLVLIVLADAVYRWYRILSGPQTPAELHEAPVVESKLVAA